MIYAILLHTLAVIGLAVVLALAAVVAICFAVDKTERDPRLTELDL